MEKIKKILLVYSLLSGKEYKKQNPYYHSMIVSKIEKSIYRRCLFLYNKIPEYDYTSAEMEGCYPDSKDLCEACKIVNRWKNEST